MPELPSHLQLMISDLVRGVKRDLSTKRKSRVATKWRVALAAALALASGGALAAIPGAPLNQLFDDRPFQAQPALERMGFLSGSTSWPPGTGGVLGQADFIDLGVRDATVVADGVTVLICDLPEGPGPVKCTSSPSQSGAASPIVIPAETHWYRSKPRPDRPGPSELNVYFPSRKLMVELSPGAVVYANELPVVP